MEERRREEASERGGRRAGKGGGSRGDGPGWEDYPVPGLAAAAAPKETSVLGVPSGRSRRHRRVQLSCDERVSEQQCKHTERLAGKSQNKLWLCPSRSPSTHDWQTRGPLRNEARAKNGHQALGKCVAEAFRGY
ncbi:hypothetical protein D4764_15G0012820 [Takifugu flavidus]|uniref:Uncharacterized protein n=1 Tax=Takifugu flavidus TaxID=433684 RepID=A0A5C6P4B3_9TELE|nr:hypothetical protein D4764_15G0012820 [Takifugu flavidus]